MWRPVSRIFTEAPIWSSVLKGDVSGSSPAVAKFSPRSPGPTSKPEFAVQRQFAQDEMDLPLVWRPRLSARQISVPDKLAVVGIAFDPMSRRQNDGEAGSLAELMLGIERYGDDRSSQNRLFSEGVGGALGQRRRPAH